MIVAFNRDTRERKVTIRASGIGLKDGEELANLTGTSGSASVATGQAALNIPRRTAVAYGVR